MRYFYILLLLVFFMEKTTAQDTYLLGTLPSLNFI